MSGIYALLNRTGAPVLEGELSLMGQALQVDGPDGHGQTLRGPCGLGHRLMRFTPEDDHERQPAGCLDGDIVMVVDGRVDNRRELTREFGLTAAEAAEMPDSAFVLRAYERWQERCLQHLVGEFSFVCWSNQRHRLVAAESALTARPLFYRVTPTRIAVASRACALHALSDARPELDLEWLGGILATVDVGQERTAFREVKRLCPGYLLAVEGDRISVIDWWEPDLEATIELPRDEDYVEAFDELLHLAVIDQLRSQGPAALALSGGLDSSSVAVVAAEGLGRRQSRLSAYTEVPPPGFAGQLPAGRYADEGPRVRQIVEMWPNIDLELLTPPAAEPLAELEDFFAAAEMPFPNPPNWPGVHAIATRARANGIRTILNGDYGNLTVSWGGAGRLAELVRAGSLLTAVREARTMAGAGLARSTPRALFRQGIEPLLPERLGHLLGPHGRGGAQVFPGSPFLNPALAADLGLGGRQAPIRPRLSGQSGRQYRLSSLRWMARWTSQVQIAGRVLYGIDPRNPLGDRRVVEFCLAIPDSQYQRAGEDRWLIRRAMKGRLPDEVLNGRTRGLQDANWFERGLAARATRLEYLRRFEEDPLVPSVIEVGSLRRVLERWPVRPPANPSEVALLQHGVELALMTGRFLLWARSAIPLRPDLAIGAQRR